MLACLDVDYRATSVVAAGVGFADWQDGDTALELVIESDAPPAAYEPGRFFARELPHLESVLVMIAAPLDAIVVDGYVWLAPDRLGLGAHLYDRLARTTPVIGVAKTAFAGATAVEVVRGASTRPLYVTAAGIDVTLAADHVREMHGDHRIPTLLRRVDQLARQLSSRK